MHTVRGRRARLSLARAAALAVAGAVLLTGCGGLKKSIDKINRENSASSSLAGFIQQELTTKFRRSVRSVTCTPYVDEVVPGDTAHLTCRVRFTDGSSYSTRASVNDPSTDPDIATYTYSFTDPPTLDITTAPLPRPAVTLAATSPASLLRRRNLAPVLRRLAARLGRHDLIMQLAVYPGAVEAVAGASGEARSVSVTDAGVLTAGPPVSFDGSRSGIEISQLSPAVIQRLTQQIVARGRVRLAAIGRFVLTSLPHGEAGWTIYPTSGTARFRALLQGQDLVMITPQSRRSLG
jgi:hypothetical protein